MGLCEQLEKENGGKVYQAVTLNTTLFYSVIGDNMKAEEVFREVLVKVFEFTEEEAREYVNNDDKWLDENTIELPNGWCLTFNEGIFELWTSIADYEWFAEMIEREFSIDVKNNKVADNIIKTLMDRVASEINNKMSFEALTDYEFIHVQRVIKGIEGIKEVIKKEVPVIEKIKEKLDSYKCFYEYLTPSEIQRLLLSKVTYVAPVQIKKIGGSYGVVIPMDVLKMFVNEEVLKEGKEITAKLRANANSGEIVLSDFEF